MLRSVLKLEQICLKFSCGHHTMARGRTLESVLEQLEKFAPSSTAESWDNVGLLIEPYKPKLIKNIILTNDLTETVASEAIAREADLIISYHPPIFAPLKCFRQSNWKERIVTMCLAESISVYSPHTAWDAAPNGVNDWLASALPIAESKPIYPNPIMTNGGGSGRICKLSIELSLGQAIAAVQKHIGLHVHVAVGVSHNMATLIKTAAVCAGSGATVLKQAPADLYITGEMPHHEVLDANHRNVSVILCNHSNSERGFLKVFKTILHEMLDGDCQVLVSDTDADPLNTFVYIKE